MTAPAHSGSLDPLGASYAAAVHAWADHLRAGGTDRWDAARWSRAIDEGASSTPPPSAVHLELLRRWNLQGHGPAPAGLADVVLTTPRPGRGPVDPPLPWTEQPRFGSPGVDPATIDDELLVRLATGVVVRLLSGAPDASPPAPLRRRRAWPWRTRFRVHGTRLATATVRDRLLAAGAAEGGRRPVHLVLGLPLEAAMAEHWSGRVTRDGILGWRALWRRTATADRLPHPVDVDRLAERLAAEHGGRVHVVLAPDRAGLATAALDVLGLTDRPGPPSTPLRLARWDLQRRVNLLATLARGPVTGAPLARRLAPVLDGLDHVVAHAAPAAPAAPAAYWPWATRAAADLATRVAEAGYPVHGDPGVLARPAPRTGRRSVDPSETLELALAACLRLWRTQEGRPGVTQQQPGAPDPEGQVR